ncbi:MAG: DUF4491 family protein [Clostridium sp.]|nr:DUF4491 family protein [Clostridium sp.]
MSDITFFLSENNLLGLAIGISTFLIIGMFHPIVIKAEYYFGVGCWWYFLIAGLCFCALAWVTTDVFLSSLCGVIAFSSFWSIKELFEQRERVAKGWFPANPARRSPEKETDKN